MVKPDRIEPIIREYRDQLAGILGEALEAVVLYGSHARGDAQEGSDIDIMCVMRLPFDYGTLIMNTAHEHGRSCRTDQPEVRCGHFYCVRAFRRVSDTKHPVSDECSP